MLPYNDFAANGNNPLNSVSQPKGALHCPFPRAPIPKTEIMHPCGGSSVEKESLSTHEDADLFLGMVKLQTGDTSIVDKAGTFLLWYDSCLI
jgi:hypothetical protein